MNKVRAFTNALLLGLLTVSAMAIAPAAAPAKHGARSAPQTPDELPQPPPPPPPGPPPKNADAAVINTISTLKDRVEEYHREHHAWPSSLDQVDLADYYKEPRPMMQSETLGPDGVITATFRSDVHGVGGKSLRISPAAQPDGTYVWKCSGIDLNMSDFPETCGP